MNLKEKLIVPFYWLLFIFLPLIVVGSVILNFQYPKWVLAVVGLVVLLGGEHGLRKWAALFTKSEGSQRKD